MPRPKTRRGSLLFRRASNQTCESSHVRRFPLIVSEKPTSHAAKSAILLLSCHRRTIWAAALMKVFGDTVHFIALLSTGDRWHAQAVAISRQSPGPLLTTEWVLTEVGNAFSRPVARQKFVRLLNLLREQPDAEIVPSTSDLFQRGTEFFSARPDKEWSLTIESPLGPTQ
jgi:predicted nucleic acid-binding protein